MYYRNVFSSFVLALLNSSGFITNFDFSEYFTGIAIFFYLIMLLVITDNTNRVLVLKPCSYSGLKVFFFFFEIVKMKRLPRAFELPKMNLFHLNLDRRINLFRAISGFRVLFFIFSFFAKPG